MCFWDGTGMSLRDVIALPYRKLRAVRRYIVSELPLESRYERGHYHSPLPDIDEGSDAASAAARRPIGDLPGIQVFTSEQRRLAELLPASITAFDWTDHRSEGRRYYTEQNFFRYSDGLVLYHMLLNFRPKRIIEVGSGHSSSLMMDINEREFGGEIALTFIEPNPQRLYQQLDGHLKDSVSVIETFVQNADMDQWGKLKSNDILFIDSSHVAKVGGDVNHLFLEILPTLAPGVIVHIHDVFWPFDYPASWIERGWAWNEAYLLRAFLAFNSKFEILFWAPAAATLVDKKTSNALDGGQSIWIRCVPESSPGYS